MAFTGTPVVTRVSEQLARITGLSLGSGATGTISLNEGAGQVKLPDSLNWSPYAGQDTGVGAVVDLVESVEVDWHFVADPGVNYGPSGRVFAVKSGGAAPSTFLITMQNADTSESVSAQFEIYIRFH